MRKIVIVFVFSAWSCIAVEGVGETLGTENQIETAKKTIIKRRKYENIEVVSLKKTWKSRYYSKLEKTVRKYSPSGSKTIESSGYWRWELKFYSTKNKYGKLYGIQEIILSNNLKTIIYYE